MTTTYVKIAKASGTSYREIPKTNGSSRYGFAIYGTSTYGNSGSTYTNIPKAAGTIYTKIPKAT